MKSSKIQTLILVGSPKTPIGDYYKIGLRAHSLAEEALRLVSCNYYLILEYVCLVLIRNRVKEILQRQEVAMRGPVYL